VAKTLEDVRFFVERETGPLENQSVINWCNECNIDIGAHINIPAPTYQIALNTTDLDYPLPADLKQINRLWLQSEYDNGINRDLNLNYRIYNGRIHFPVPFPFTDTLNIDYYKTLKHFTTITDEIDLPDRFMTVYTFYCAMRFYSLPETQEKLTELVARRNFERATAMYQMAKAQAIQNYEFQNPSLAVHERW